MHMCGTTRCARGSNDKKNSAGKRGSHCNNQSINDACVHACTCVCVDVLARDTKRPQVPCGERKREEEATEERSKDPKGDAGNANALGMMRAHGERRSRNVDGTVSVSRAIGTLLFLLLLFPPKTGEKK